MPFNIFNYLSRKIEEFVPLQEGRVGLYVCGPTVYGDAHLGHAKAYITFDVLRRYLEHTGYKVRYVQNITDVGHLVGDNDEGEDKIGKKARLDRIEPMELVETYTRNYFRDMDALNVKRPSISPRASGHVPEQIELAEILIEKGIAYSTAAGNVYFSILRWKEYGKLSRRNLEELSEGSRFSVSDDKLDPRDFAVWRAVKPGQLMKWKSPWGEGFPGWHAECVVMSRKYLGLPFDIHGGGLENIFPHNESEIAQAEAAFGKGFARYWVLNNMVTLEGKKMGKSLGNAISLSQLFSGNHELLSRGFHPMVVRFFIMGSHYRQNTDFSDSALSAAKSGYERLVSVTELLDHAATDKKNDLESGNVQELLLKYAAQFYDAMNDDLNTPKAIAAIFDLTREVNILINSGSNLSGIDIDKLKIFYQTYAGDILGLIPEAGQGVSDASRNDIIDNLMELIVDLRTNARSNKDFKTADKIRNKLNASGVELEDRKDGTVWKIK